jgi:glutamine amidotransferase
MEKGEIVIVDYGLGNLASVRNMIKKAGGVGRISSDLVEIANADKLILPGVGYFGKGMQNIHQMGLTKVLNKKVLVDKTPVLGICLGMQLMTNFSEEGNSEGLGWIDAITEKFVYNSSSIKIPNIGWNEIAFKKESLFRTDEEQRFYFVHSYKVSCRDESDVLAIAVYGGEPYVCAFQRDNIIGMQFHPEKSHRFGVHVFQRFIQDIN